MVAHSQVTITCRFIAYEYTYVPYQTECAKVCPGCLAEDELAVCLFAGQLPQYQISIMSSRQPSNCHSQTADNSRWQYTCRIRTI